MYRGIRKEGAGERRRPGGEGGRGDHEERELESLRLWLARQRETS
jgi:hypothetical protein